MATPPSPDQAPMARLRSSAIGTTPGGWPGCPGSAARAPTPWRTRVAMRTPVPGASAQAAEATANHDHPDVEHGAGGRTGRPATRRASSSAARASVYPVTTHWRVPSGAWNSPPDGREGDADDRPVDRRHARPEHRGGGSPRPPAVEYRTRSPYRQRPDGRAGGDGTATSGRWGGGSVGRGGSVAERRRRRDRIGGGRAARPGRGRDLRAPGARDVRRTEDLRSRWRHVPGSASGGPVPRGRHAGRGAGRRAGGAAGSRPGRRHVLGRHGVPGRVGRGPAS